MVTLRSDKVACMSNIKKTNGFLLNKAETGVSLGSLGSYARIWDHESCKEISKKYSTVSEFMRQARGAYAAALSNGWIEEIAELVGWYK